MLVGRRVATAELKWSTIHISRSSNERIAQRHILITRNLLNLVFPFACPE